MQLLLCLLYTYRPWSYSNTLLYEISLDMHYTCLLFILIAECLWFWQNTACEIPTPSIWWLCCRFLQQLLCNASLLCKPWFLGRRKWSRFSLCRSNQICLKYSWLPNNLIWVTVITKFMRTFLFSVFVKGPIIVEQFARWTVIAWILTFRVVCKPLRAMFPNMISLQVAGNKHDCKLYIVFYYNVFKSLTPRNY